jgi:ribosomal protein S12 methylthiotransferase accessory factor
MEVLARKPFRRGTHRLTTPVATLERVRHLLRSFGITRVANVTGLDAIGIPVTMVFRPNSRSLAVSPGKGLDLDAARASGVMEAIELFHAERILLPLKLASWEEMELCHTLPALDSLPVTSLGAFHRRRPLLWIEGTERMTSGAVWVPYELVHANFTLPLPPGSGSFVLTSNGLASGNHLLEAISHGICEVIERDAVTLFACRGSAERQALRVDLRTVEDADVRSLLALYDRADVAVAAWDLTSDVGVPVFACRVTDRSENAFRIVPAAEGWGCHPVREVALCRALTEAAQCRLVRISGSRDDQGWRRYAEAREYSRNGRAEAADESACPRRFEETPSIHNDTFEEDVSSMTKCLARAGMPQVITIDLTQPELAAAGGAVVRVIVPGLEPHFQFPGARLGRRARRMLETSGRELPS